MTSTIIQWFTPAIVGGCIGYITNWLAIKMLFRPYKEKRIGPIKIPFTPGLIPKEQHRIAHSVGQTIEEHLLTTEVVMNVLESSQVQKQIKKNIQQSILHLQQEEMTIQDWIEKIIDNDVDILFTKWESKAICRLMEELKDPKLQQQLASWILLQIKQQLQKPEMEQKFQDMQQKWIQKGFSYLQQEQIQAQFYYWLEEKIKEGDLSNRSMKEWVSPSMIQAVESYISIQGPTVAFYIQKFFHQPLVENKIKTFITQILQNYVGKLATMFVNPNKIYQKILGEMEEYLLEEENQKDLIEFVMDIFHQIINKPVVDFWERVPTSLKQQSYYSFFQRLFSVENQKKLVEWYKDAQNKNPVLSFTYWCNSFFDSYENVLLEWFIHALQEVSESNIFKVQLQKVSTHCRKELLKYPVYHLFRKIKPTVLEEIEDKVIHIYIKWIREKGPSMLQFINVSQIIKNQIESFDMAYTEKIILSIAKRELQAITWLGALLGFIMGIVLNFI